MMNKKKLNVRNRIMICFKNLVIKPMKIRALLRNIIRLVSFKKNKTDRFRIIIN